MNFFGRKSAGRDVSRPALLRGFSRWIGGTEPLGSYDAQVRAGYMSNPIAQRAVRLVSEGVASAPLTAGDPALLSLLAARTAGQTLIETIALGLTLHGNAFIQVVRDTDDKTNSLFALRPERVTVETDARGWPTAYLYRAGEIVSRFAAEDDFGQPLVIHIKAPHPLDDHYGLGCLGAATGAIAIHNAATQWNRTLLDNAARPSGALVYDPGDGTTLTADQFDRLRAELDESFVGKANAGRPLLLEGGLRWQPLAMTPADMDFATMKATAAREIALAFGVPPMLLGLPGDATYANYREANKALWRLTILPLAGLILDGLSDGLRGRFADASLSVDLDRVPALSEERAALWAQVSGADFLSPQEKRAMLGIAA
jgi:HK97 family phage portal protein